MKICHIIAYPGIGGAEQNALYLAMEASHNGHEVSFILGQPGPLEARLKKAGIVYEIIPMNSSFNPVSVWGAVFKIRKYLNKLGIELTHAHMLREQSLVIGARIFGSKTKLVRTFHRLDQFNWKMKPLMPIYRKKTDAFIAVSEYTKKLLVENGIKDNVEVILNGVPEVKKSGNDNSLGFLGRVTPEKGILSFVEENKKVLEKTPLVIGGVGEDLDEIREIAKTNNLKIETLGLVENKDAFFSKISVLVIPSLTESTFPLVGIEAYSCGIPVVMFDLPAAKDLVVGKEYLANSFNYRDLYDLAIKVGDSADYDKRSKIVRDYYLQKFTIDRMWQETEALYNKVLT